MLRCRHTSSPAPASDSALARDPAPTPLLLFPLNYACRGGVHALEACCGPGDVEVLRYGVLEHGRRAVGPGDVEV